MAYRVFPDLIVRWYVPGEITFSALRFEVRLSALPDFPEAVEDCSTLALPTSIGVARATAGHNASAITTETNTAVSRRSALPPASIAHPRLSSGPIQIQLYYIPFI